jgi:hypothetical protein
MESAITSEFLKNIQTVTQRYVTQVSRNQEAATEYLQEVEQESRQFAAAIQAIRSVKPVSKTEPPSGYLHQLQKTIAGLSEDIGDLNSRLSLLERQDEPPPWVSSAEFEFLSERLDDDETAKNIVVHFDESDSGDVDMGRPIVIQTPVAAIPSTELVVMPAAATVPSTEPEPEAPVEELAEEEEEEALELEEFTHEGTSYYKDTDNNVYSVNTDGEVNETPIGRWLEKRQTIKLYTT